MQNYGQFSVFPLIDKLPIWRDPTRAAPLAVANRGQKLRVMSREGELYRVRLPGVGYGYVSANDVVSESDAARASSRPGGYPLIAGEHRMKDPDIREDALGSYTPIGFLERLVAYVIDAIVLVVIYLGVSIAFALGGNSSEVEGTGGFLVANDTRSLVSFLINALYFIGFWSMFGATPGKLVMGQRVVHATTGELILPGACILRFIGLYISAIPLGLGFLWIIWDKQKQGWHDKIANTRVIRTR